jgi:uncharacterized protein
MSVDKFQELKNILYEQKAYLETHFYVKQIGVFGSYVRGEQTDKSDIDILVELNRPMGFVKFIKLENYLSTLLGRKVDLVSSKALKPYIGQNILAEVKYV